MATIYGTGVNDLRHGTPTPDRIYLYAGDDTANGRSGDDTIWGGDGKDSLYGGNGRDSLYGESGYDRMFGGDRNDWLDGGAQGDQLFGGNGDDWLGGGAGNDRQEGDDGNDRLDGGNGSDKLYGEAGDDRLNGGGGHDRVDGGDGDDLLRGGGGHDRFVFDADEAGSDVIRDFQIGTGFASIDFSDSFNRSINSRGSGQGVFPTGDVTLGGVPFDIPTSGNNQWSSGDGFGGNRAGKDGQWVLNVDTDLFGVDNVYTLISSDWGTTEHGHMFVEFFGSDGAHYEKELVGDRDIRDWNLYPGYTTEINETTTLNVFTSPNGKDGNPDVLDMQVFDLPDDFLDETLTAIRVTDNRVSFMHSGIVAGITAAIDDDTLVLGHGSGLSDVTVRANADDDAVISWMARGRASQVTLEDVNVGELQAAWNDVVLGVPASDVDFL
jgi:hypothetical protein